MPKQFIVGKTYKTVVPNFFPYGGITSIGITFTCNSIDENGDCWSNDLNKIRQDNCVVSLSELEDDSVVKV